MNIGLMDVDGKYPNIALMKISTFSKTKGDNVEMVKPFGVYDRVYKSKLFDFTIEKDPFITTGEVITGGTGYQDIKKILPYEIESCQPDYTIYPQFKFSIQRFSLGCLRQCPFCLVPEKEGLIRSITPMNLNLKGEWIEVIDNSFFGNPEWELACNYLIAINQPVNFHGIDARILQEKQAWYLNQMHHLKQIKIAWDNPKMDMVPMLQQITQWIKPYKLMCYVLIGYWSSPEEDYERVMKLRNLKIDPFVMPYNKKDKYQRRFARWVNHKAIFKTVDWREYNG